MTPIFDYISLYLEFGLTIRLPETYSSRTLGSPQTNPPVGLLENVFSTFHVKMSSSCICMSQCYHFVASHIVTTVGLPEVQLWCSSQAVMCVGKHTQTQAVQYHCQEATTVVQMQSGSTFLKVNVENVALTQRQSQLITLPLRYFRNIPVATSTPWCRSTTLSLGSSSNNY